MQKAAVGGPVWYGESRPTHPGPRDEVWELPCASMQNGFLDPFHVQEQSGIHGSRPREVSGSG